MKILFTTYIRKNCDTTIDEIWSVQLKAPKCHEEEKNSPIISKKNDRRKGRLK